MVFSSTIFLFCFLPILLLVYFLSPKRAKNSILLAASLLFYAWGEFFYTALMVFSILANYTFGILIGYSRSRRTQFLVLGVICNLTVLGIFKYANFILDNLNNVFTLFTIAKIEVQPVHLPLGISFFTFQAISYLVDVYRKENTAQKNILNLGLYITLFPQLIAGPIVRYNSIARQLVSRIITLQSFEAGTTRFIYGLAKKLLIANPLGEVADKIFLLPVDQLPALVAWTGILCFTLQIYFDFSGYSDMAIGLGRMFGFTFPENFNYPYIARSLRDFWKRWHISLTNWLRDYLYIPMGGNRGASLRVTFNLLTVFILCGLWHGASWNFLLWGLWHGLFLSLERSRFGNAIAKSPAIVAHGYTLLIVIVGWVFFRLSTFDEAIHYLFSMVGSNGFANSMYPIQLYITNEAILAAIAAIVLSTSFFIVCEKYFQRSTWYSGMTKLVLVTLLLSLSMLKISSGTYNPFLYFRF
jgi:alginate O-acetyltransferase complex protein AlgI